MTALYQKYAVYKANDDDAVRLDDCFVLRPARDPAARYALRAYAKATPDESLALSLRMWLSELNPRISNYRAWFERLEHQKTDEMFCCGELVWYIKALEKDRVLAECVGHKDNVEFSGDMYVNAPYTMPSDSVEAPLLPGVRTDVRVFDTAIFARHTPVEFSLGPQLAQKNENDLHCFERGPDHPPRRAGVIGEVRWDTAEFWYFDHNGKAKIIEFTIGNYLDGEAKVRFLT